MRFVVLFITYFIYFAKTLQLATRIKLVWQLLSRNLMNLSGNYSVPVHVPLECEITTIYFNATTYGPG